MTVRVITPPAIEPITLADAKLHLREDDSSQDTLISLLIKAAREYAERYTGRAFIERELELTLSGFTYEIFLPRPPLISVASVKYIDTAGTLQTVAAADYQVDSYAEPGRIKPAYLESWPAVRTSDFNAVQIRYRAGYPEIGSPTGVDPTNGVPELVRHWMRVRVAQLYETREAIVVGTVVAQVPRDFVDGLLDPLRVGVLAAGG